MKRIIRQNKSLTDCILDKHHELKSILPDLMRDIEKAERKKKNEIVVKRIPSRASWVEIGGEKIYFRSTWEKKYAFYLEWLKGVGQVASWEHEPKTFWFEAIKRGTRSYLPDFKVTRLDGTHHWVEVKGFMDARSKTKLKRFKKYYPNEKMYVVDATWFKGNENILRSIPGCYQAKTVKRIPKE